MKTGRNDPCPCGSGKKYKKCCLGKTNDQHLAEAIVDSMNNIKNEARIKQCLHPKHEECNGKIVKAHAIQNNRILNKIAENGMLVTLDGVSHYMFQTSDTKGRGITTAFTGFCAYHDKTLFQEIEDKDFIGSNKQIFLLTYRTMAWHYHKKQEQTMATCIQAEKMYSHGFDIAKSEDFVDFLTGLKLGLNDNNIEKGTFDEALLRENYDSVHSIIWEIPYEISMAVSMMTEIEYDINGNQINDLLSDNTTHKIYLNIFPSAGKSYCIWSWSNISDEVYQSLSEQFLQLSVADKENYLNNNLPRWSDAIVISPRLWNKWGEPIQEALITHANFDILYRAFEREGKDRKYQYMDTPWNLFENIT